MSVLIFNLSYLERYCQQVFKESIPKSSARGISWWFSELRGGEWHQCWRLFIDTVAVSRYTTCIFFLVEGTPV